MTVAERTITISLAGRTWELPAPTLRQMLKMLPIIRKLPIVKDGVGGSGVTFELDAENLETISQIVHAAIARVDPDFTLDQFLDQDIGINELITALALVASQVGSGMQSSSDRCQQGAENQFLGPGSA